MAPQFDRPLRDLLRAAGCIMVRQEKEVTKFGIVPSLDAISPFPSEFPAATPANAILRRPD